MSTVKVKLTHIKIVTYDNFPYGGAPANFIRNFAESLALQSNNLVEVILPTGNYGSINNINKSRYGLLNSIKFRHLALIRHPKHMIGKLLDHILGAVSPIVYLTLKQMKSEVDIIIMYNTSFTTIIPFLIIKRIIKKKLILILPEYYERPKGRLAQIKWINFFWGIEYYAKYADKFIVLTEYLKNDLLSKSVQIKNIYVLPNLTEPEVFYTNDVSKYRQDDITIGYCGTPTRKDGVLDLLESFAMLCQKTKKVHLLIIGDVVSGISVIPSLEERAKILGISDKVSFTGLVPHSKIPHLLNSCQILALTRPNGVSAEAGFPSKLGEYFACRKPVLVTKVGDIPKYFVSGEHAIIVEPGDIFGIAKGFQEIIENNELASKIAANGYLWMSNNIDFKKASHMLNQFIA